MEFHGWLDETISYEGGENTRGNAETPPIPVWVDDWAKRDGCSAAQNSSTKLCSGKKSVIRYAWNCKGMDDAVVHYNISNLKFVPLVLINVKEMANTFKARLAQHLWER
jgi:poly(3-hydroxybutyrate) depolymerase